jgi:hypothetical protein
MAIMAYPDTEFERFSEILRQLPIANADDPKERFPVRISRRSFPRQPNMSMQEVFQFILK